MSKRRKVTPVHAATQRYYNELKTLGVGNIYIAVQDPDDNNDYPVEYASGSTTWQYGTLTRYRAYLKMMWGIH